MYGGCQCSSRAALEQRVAQLGVAAAVAEVPLARRDDLERPVAPLVELHRVRDRAAARRRARPTRAAARRSRACACLAVLPGELARTRRGAGRRRPSGGSATRRPSRPMIAAGRQLQLAPPHDVGGVAERADHRDAGALLGVGELGARAPGPARRTAACVTVVPNAGLVALVVGVGDQRDARGEQLGPRRLDDDVAGAVDAVEREAGGTRPAARGPRARPARPRCGSRRPRASAPRPGTPRRGRGCAGTPAARRAARPLADRRVRQRPVDRQAEPAPQLLERLLVLDDEARRTARRSSAG